MSDTYVRLPGKLRQREIWRLRDWLPALQQVWDALLFRLPDALDPHERGVVTASMRQGLGLVFFLGLVAGIAPFIDNLWLSVTVGAAAPLASLGQSAAQWLAAYGSIPAVEIAAHTLQSVAGLEPRMPGVLAALLSSLGLWLNTPLNWLSLWIIYGALVLATARFMGARATLETFFAATSFAFAPLVLTGFVSLPFVGPVAVAGGRGLGLFALCPDRVLDHPAERRPHRAEYAAANRRAAGAADARRDGGRILPALLIARLSADIPDKVRG
jgi:hypothetical protein